MFSSDPIGCDHEDSGDSISPAGVGDVARIAGWCRVNGSGLAMLLLNQPRRKSYLVGDWRSIRDIADDLAGREVVVEGIGSVFGEGVQIVKQADKPY